MGTSIAWALAEHNLHSIDLFERNTIACEASGKTGALLRRHYSNQPEAELAHLGYSVFRDWHDVIGGSCGHVPAPLVVTVDCSGEHSANVEKLHTNVAMQHSVGIDSEVVSAEELARLLPYANVDDLIVASWEPSSGYVDAVAATRGMAHAAIARRATVREGVNVQTICVESGKVVGLETALGKISTDIVIVANGSWAPYLLQPLGIEVPISSLRVQIAILHRPLSLEEPHAVFIDTAAGMFTRPWGPGRSLVGVGGGDQHDNVDPDNYNPGNDLTYSEAAMSAVSRRIPDMRLASYLHGHAGLYDMTPDAHPIIGPTAIAGLYIAAGFSGAGFKKGPAVGLCLAEQIVGKEPQVDLTPFSLSRFDDDTWQKPWSDTEYTFTSDFGHGL